MRRWDDEVKAFFLVCLVLFLGVGCGGNGATSEAASTAVPTTASTSLPTLTPPPLPQATETTPPTAVPPTMGAADADVVNVRAVETAANVWTFHVTVAHSDTGWEDYADGWDVLLPDGTVVKPDPDSPFTRLLLHPHENEQPFTRSQTNVEIPPDVTEVTVRAHDIVDGFGGEEVVVDLTAVSGPNFEVERLDSE